MPRTSRRGFLRAGAAAGLGAVAGCLGGRGGGDGLTLLTLDAPGSPGGPIAVAPAGRVVLLDFFATWCAPCKPQMESLGAVHDAYPDVHQLSITTETDEAAIRDFWRTYGGRWPVATDPELRATERFGVRGIPTLVVLDPGGAEVWRHVGLAARDDIERALRDAGA